MVPGTSFTYTITVSSNGPSTALNVSVSDPLPTGLTSFVWSGNGHTNVSGAISDTIASLAPGTSVVYTATATVRPTATGTLSNTVTVSAANGTNPNNNSATVTDNLTPQADLSILKTSGTTTAVPGTNITYNITVISNGPSTVTGAMVSDVLPAGTTFVSATNGATYDSGTNTVSFTTGTLANGGTDDFRITLAINLVDTGTLSNTATVAPPVGAERPRQRQQQFHRHGHVDSPGRSVHLQDRQQRRHAGAGGQRHLRHHGYQQRSQHRDRGHRRRRLAGGHHLRLGHQRGHLQ